MSPEFQLRCPRCGYRLDTVASSKCPECGLELVVGVLPAHTPTLAWMALLTASALVAGTGIHRWCAYLPNVETVVARLFGGAFPWYFTVLDIVILVSPILLILAAFRARSLWRRGATLSWVLAALSLAVFATECATLLF